MNNMIWEIRFAVKGYPRNWSNQKIVTQYKGVGVEVVIKDYECGMKLIGEKNVEDTFYLLWELLFLYDGYFYTPQNWIVDGRLFFGEPCVSALGFTDSKKGLPHDL